MDFEFDALKREFLSEAEQKVREITSVLSGDFPPVGEHLERMIYLAHQLKGAGGSYGFAAISTESAELEKELEHIVAGDGVATRDGLSARVGRIAEIIDERSRELAARV